MVRMAWANGMHFPCIDSLDLALNRMFNVGDSGEIGVMYCEPQRLSTRGLGRIALGVSGESTG